MAGLGLYSQAAFQARFNKLVKGAVEYGLGVACLHIGAQILDT